MQRTRASTGIPRLSNAIFINFAISRIYYNLPISITLEILRKFKIK